MDTTLVSFLVRSWLMGAFVFVVLVVSMLGASLTRGYVPAMEPRHGPDGVKAWEESYSRRYPGCVSMVLWPADEKPVALVTRTPDGHVARIPLGDEPVRLPARSATIGACR